MKKSLFILSSVLISSVLFFSCHKTGSSAPSKQERAAIDESRKNEVIIYTYDSFVSEWGPAAQIAENFEKSTGLKATFVDCGDGLQVFSRALLEKDSVQADIILGLDNNTSKKAIDSGILDSYKPKDADKVISETVSNTLGGGDYLTPYDYSHFALIFDTRSNLPEPKSLSDLTNPIYKNQIVLMDPRTSTPGLGFVAWTRAIFQNDEDFSNFWTSLKPNILSMASSWSAGYGLFTKGEAPLVTSYTTSPAANLEYDKINYYKALIFEEGHSIQVEGAGILKNAPNKEGAKLFMDFLISEPAQSVLPLTQWMYPANKNVALPDCYEKAAAIPTKTVTVSADVLDSAVEKVTSILK